MLSMWPSTLQCIICRVYIDHDQEPLNSNDDLSDEDSAEIFDVDNVVVCQFDKVRPTISGASKCTSHIAMILSRLDQPQQKQVEVPPERRHHESQGKGLHFLQVNRRG